MFQWKLCNCTLPKKFKNILSFSNDKCVACENENDTGVCVHVCFAIEYVVVACCAINTSYPSCFHRWEHTSFLHFLDTNVYVSNTLQLPKTTICFHSVIDLSVYICVFVTCISGTFHSVYGASVHVGLVCWGAERITYPAQAVAPKCAPGTIGFVFRRYSVGPDIESLQQGRRHNRHWSAGHAPCLECLLLRGTVCFMYQFWFWCVGYW